MPATRGKKAAAAKAAAAEAEEEPPKEGAAAAETEAPAPAPAPAPKASPTRGRGKKRSAPEPEPEPEPEPAPEPAAADPPAAAPAAAEAAAPAPAPAPAAKAPAAKAPAAKAPAAAAAAKSTDAVEEPPAKRQVLPPRVHDVTVLLPIDAVGLIIGKGGLTMKRLVEESGAAIRVQEYMDMAKNSKQRGVTIRGNFEAIEQAEREIMDLLRQRRQKAEEARAAAEKGEVVRRKTLRWLIPAEMSGLLIGKRGIGREAIQQETGAFIKIAHEQELPPGSTEKLVYIEGQTDEAIEAARALVEAKVGGRPMDKDGDDFVYVNTRAIGFLLGKGGADLKKMCEESGARIQVASAAELETGSIEIKVRLMGEADKVKKAKALLLERMHKWHADHPPRDHSRDPDGRESSIKVAIPAAAISALIGKGGAGVKEMNAQSGASLKFLADQSSHDAGVDFRPILLTGNLRNIFKAQRILFERLAALPPAQRAPARPKLAAAAAPTAPHPGVGLLDGARPNTTNVALLQTGAGAGGVYAAAAAAAGPGLLGNYQQG